MLFILRYFEITFPMNDDIDSYAYICLRYFLFISNFNIHRADSFLASSSGRQKYFVCCILAAWGLPTPPQLPLIHLIIGTNTFMRAADFSIISKFRFYYYCL